MGLFSVFSKSKTRNSRKGQDVECASVAKSMGSRTTSSNVSKSSQTHKVKEQSLPYAGGKESEMDINKKIAERWMKAMSVYNFDDPQEYIKKVAAFYESENCPVIMEDGEAYKPDACNQLLHLTFQSFPDFKLSWGEVVSIDNNPNRIAVEAIFTQGTFNGKPYSILPGVFPEVQPNGEFICNDEQRFELEIKDGKITRVEVYALGISTGFAGFYTKAGGSLVPPSATDEIPVEE